MSVFRSNIQEIFIFDPSAARATVSAFSKRVNLKNSDTQVSVFLLSEIRNEQHQQNQRLIKDLQDLLVSEFMSSIPPVTEAIFEEILHNVNRHFPALLDNVPEDFLRELTFVAGVISGNAIHFSQVGPANILFIQSGKLSELSDHSLQAPVNPLKIFKEITSGKLEDPDILFISSNNFLDYFSQEKIKRLLEENVNDSVAAAFDEFLVQAPLTASFAGLSLSVEKNKPQTVDQMIAEKQTSRVMSTTGNQSMQELIEREQITDDILTPKFLPSVKRKTIEWWYKSKNFIKGKILRKPTRISPVLLEKSAEEPRQFIYTKRGHGLKQNISAKLLDTVKKGLGSVKTIAQKTVSRVQIPTKEKIPFQAGPDIGVKPSPRKPFHLIGWFQGLPRGRKFLVIGITLLVVIFAQSIVFAGIRNEQSARRAVEDEQRTVIEKAILEIDAAILYGDDARIQQALDTLIERRDSLDQSRFEELYQETQNAIATAELKLERIQEIKGLSKLASLSELVNNQEIIDLQNVGTSLFLLDSAGSNVVRVNTDTGEGELLSLGEATPQYLAASEDTVFILANDFSLFQANGTSSEASGVSFGGAQGTYNIAGIGTYLGRLYLIDIAQNQILRASRFGGGVGSPTAWLDEEVDMSQATAMTIDGAIYVGYRDGDIRKFLQGAEEGFTLADLKDPVQNLSQLWTNENTSNLFALDEGLNRILIYNKNNGSLVKQLRFPELSSITAMAVNADASTLYILSNNEIYRTNLTQ